MTPGRGTRDAGDRDRDAAGLIIAQRHLAALASAPRQTDTPGAAAAQGYCAGVLREHGFSVAEQPFEYSQFPGRFGTPAGGLAGAVVLAAATIAGARGRPGAALALAAGGLLLLAIAGLWLARRGVLALPLLRRRGVNLVATRGAATPVLWLMAHADSKSQPVPMLLRAGSITALGVVWLLVLGTATTLALGGSVAPAVWLALRIAAIVSAIPVVLSTVDDRSPGAVDNASGVATMLMAAAALPVDAPVGVVITDAEEFGLAGARAWSRTAAPAHALNCDGVDDAGVLTVMYSGARPPAIVDVVRRAAREEQADIEVRHLLPGVLVDAVALHDAGFRTVTVSRGGAGTLRRIHTRNDDLHHLRGTGIPVAARVITRSALELARWPFLS